MNKHTAAKKGTVPATPCAFIHPTAVVPLNGVISSADDLHIAYILKYE